MEFKIGQKVTINPKGPTISTQGVSDLLDETSEGKSVIGTVEEVLKIGFGDWGTIRVRFKGKDFNYYFRPENLIPLKTYKIIF